MSEPDSLENRRCSGVLAPIPPKASKKGSKSVTSDVDDGPSHHQMNGYDNHVASQLEHQLESENLVNHVQTITLNGYIEGGSVNGDVSASGRNDKETKDEIRKRRSQSESSDGSPRSKNLQESDVGFMWTQTNGHHAVPEPDPNPSSPDVFYSSVHEIQTQTDDMNGYVNANAHMLAYLELNGESPRVASPENILLPDNMNGLASNGNQHEEIEDDLQSDKIDEGIALTAELEFIPLATTKLSTSSEDQGDFIETDISLQQLGFSSYASSRGSSCNDLPNLVQALDRGEHHNHNNNVTKDNGDCDKAQQHKCRSCERNQKVLGHGAYNLTLSSQYDGNSEDRGSNIKPQSLAPCSSVRHSNGAFSLPTDCRNVPQGALDDHETHTMWRNISQPPPLQRYSSTTNRSSTSSFLSPDLDIEFMDLDFEPGLVNSDSQQEFSQSESTTVALPFNNHLGSSSNHGAERDRFNDNGENIDNCFCYGCDKISDKFSNHSSHFKSCSGANANPLISCCRHRDHHHRNGGIGNTDSERGNFVKENVPKCKNCDEQRVQTDSFELRNNISGDSNGSDLLEGAVGFPGATSSQWHSVPNNLDMVGSSRDWNVLPESAEAPAHFNVSRQTSTSNFNQDENNFQDSFGVECNLNRLEGDSYSTQGKDYFTRPKNVCVQENESQLHGANLCRLSCTARQDVAGGEDDNEADDEQEEEDEGMVRDSVTNNSNVSNPAVWKLVRNFEDQ